MKTLIEIFYPKLMKTENILIRVNADLKEKFKQHAKNEGKTMSQIVVDYIEWLTEKPK